MRVALVTNSFPTLSETFVYNHAAGLEGHGIDVCVVTTAASRDGALFADFDGRTYTGSVRRAVLGGDAARAPLRLAAQLARSSSRHIALWREAHRRYGASRRALRAFLLAVPCSDFDVVHFEYSGVAVTWLDALPLLAPAKLVVSCRGTAERVTALLDPARADALRAVFEHVDRVHCVSASMRETCSNYGLPRNKAFVNHPGIDVARFRRTQPYSAHARGPLRLLSTGRLTWLKGLDSALLAVHALVAAGHDVRYEIVGSGPDETALRYAVHDLGLAERVRFAGKRSSTEVRAALEACDVYVLPSISEGISNAALEAMAMGIPVVATAVGGMPEAITDGVDGMLVPARSPHALVTAIARLLTDPALRERIGSAARRRIETEFSLDRHVATFVDEYAALRAAAPA